MVTHNSLSKFCLHCLLTLDLSFLLYVGAGIPTYHSTAHSFISLSPFPQLPLSPPPSLFIFLTLLKKRNIFILCKEIQKGSGAKSYMTKYLRISMYDFAHTRSLLNFLIYEENCLSFLTVRYLYLPPFRSKAKIFA